MTGNAGDASVNPIEELADLLRPSVIDIIERINVDEFTTVEFIDAMQLDPSALAAYHQAIDRWHEDNPEMAKMVIHGQVVPQLLRESRLVEWAGYAHGHSDPYAVPAWWKKTHTPS